MKKWIGICILCLVLSGCRNNDVPDSKIASTPSASAQILENEIAVLIIGPTGTMDETYLIELSKDRVFTTTMGTRKEDDISAIKTYEKDDFYLRIEKKESVMLSDNEFSTVDKLIDKIGTEDNSRYENYEDEWRVLDSWTNVLLTSKGVYYFNLHDIDINSSIYKLYDFLKGKSPIEIDMHGWA